MSRVPVQVVSAVIAQAGATICLHYAVLDFELSVPERVKLEHHYPSLKSTVSTMGGAADPTSVAVLNPATSSASNAWV